MVEDEFIVASDIKEQIEEMGYNRCSIFSTGEAALEHMGIIFLTAHATDDMVERAKRVEPLGYVVKPFKDVELKAMIEIALYRSAYEEKYRREAVDPIHPQCAP